VFQLNNLYLYIIRQYTVDGTDLFRGEISTIAKAAANIALRFLVILYNKIVDPLNKALPESSDI
jgi:hypothetical protein